VRLGSNGVGPDRIGAVVSQTRAALAALLALVTVGVAVPAALGGPSAKPVRVTVIATDRAFKLSRARVPPGTVVFRVRNAGRKAHDFRIAGAKTDVLKPGGSATLRVALARPGRIAFASTVGGALRGVLVVERVTTVDVDEYEFGFKLSQETVPAGKVVFAMRNTGAIVHNFDLINVKVGAFLVSGQSATMTVKLKPGSYTYVCSVKYHAAQGMQGTLTVK
jgi:plastocyanin